MLRWPSWLGWLHCYRKEPHERPHPLHLRAVTEGHPDKVADQVSDAVLDAMLAQDPMARVACETLLTTGLCVVAGEITTSAYVDINQVARQTITDIGYNDGDMGFDGRSCGILVSLDKQSPDIAGGVDVALEQRSGGDDEDVLNSLGAGDQGMMFGYACSDNEDFMPLPIWLAHRLAMRLAQVRRSGLVPYLRPDGKTQVTVAYEDGRPVAIDTVLISTQHEDGIDSLTTIKDDVLEHVIRPMLPTDLDTSSMRVFVNPSGKFVLGGPHADTGLTGRKIIVDTYGGMARHGGGAFSGKDPSKVDRSGAYAARWVAKHVVASGAAERCEVQVAYAIGVARPVSVLVDTFGTERVDRATIAKAVDALFDLRPAAIIRDLDLRRPLYQRTAAYGHFGRSDQGFTWEQTPRVDDLRRELSL
jgi:S-adenosylmethionine synthetase